MSFESEAINSALDKLLNGKYFDICILDKIGEAIGVTPSRATEYRFLRLLHCTNYSKMSAETKNQIPEKVMRCLDPQKRVNVHVMAKALLIEGNDHINTEDQTLKLVN